MMRIFKPGFLYRVISKPSVYHKSIFLAVTGRGQRTALIHLLYYGDQIMPISVYVDRFAHSSFGLAHLQFEPIGSGDLINCINKF